MSDYAGQLTATGDWVNGYRPTKLRITTEGVPLSKVVLYDTGGEAIVTEYNPESGKEIDIPPFSVDIGSIDINGHNSEGYFYITNIEFYS